MCKAVILSLWVRVQNCSYSWWSTEGSIQDLEEQPLHSSHQEGVWLAEEGACRSVSEAKSLKNVEPEKGRRNWRVDAVDKPTDLLGWVFSSSSFCSFCSTGDALSMCKSQSERITEDRYWCWGIQWTTWIISGVLWKVHLPKSSNRDSTKLVPLP